MNTKLNVCLLNDSFPPIIDGVANAVLNYAKIIEASYGKAVVATPSYPGAVDDYPFRVIRYPSVKSTKFFGYRAGIPVNPMTLRALIRCDFDIIHCHCPTVSSLIARSLRTAIKVPIIMTYHTKFDIDIANSFDSSFMQATASKLILSNIEACDEIWAVSRGAGENLESLGYAGPWRVMENGVDFPKGTADAACVRRLRGELGIDGEAPIFLFVGRIMWYKGIRTILDGLLKVQMRKIDFKMIFIGDGEDFDDVVSYARTLNLQNNCIFLGPVSDREKLRVYFSMADLFLFPSTFDTSGIVVKEAAACALASVLVRGSAAAEGTTDGRNGILINDSADALAAAVTGVAGNRAYMKSLGEKAMDELYLSWEDSVARAVERYRELLEEQKSGL